MTLYTVIFKVLKIHIKAQKTKDSQSHYEQNIRIKINGNHNPTHNLKLHYKAVIIKSSVYSTKTDA